MARYIDADKIHEFVDTKVAEGKDGWAKGVPYEWAYVLAVIDMQPTADVAPKSEVAPKRDRYYIEEGKPPVLIETSDNRRSKIASEIFEEIETYLFYHENIPNTVYKTIDKNIFTRIKKKYTDKGGAE